LKCNFRLGEEEEVKPTIWESNSCVTDM